MDTTEWFPISYLWPLLSSNLHVIADLPTSRIGEF